MLAVLQADPSRWWTYAALAQAIYGYDEHHECHAAKAQQRRLRLGGYRFEIVKRGGGHPFRFRLAEAAS